MTSQDKLNRRSKLSFLKRIFAFIGIIGVIIGAMIGGSQIIMYVQQSKKIKEEVKRILKAGDHFAANYKFNKAIEEYQNALKLDEDNIDIQQKIIIAIREKLNNKVKMFLEVGDRFAGQFRLNKAIEEYQKVLELDEENIDAQLKIISTMRKKLYLEIEPFTAVDDVLSRIYHLYALNSHLTNNIELILEEARVLVYDDSLYDALNVLETAHKSAPHKPEVLALLGLVRALTSPKDKVEDLDLLEQAIKIQPNEALYHYYRAQAFQHAENDPESIREYYKMGKLLSGKDIWSNKFHNKAIKKLDDIFMYFFRNDGALTPSINISLKERAFIYEYVIREYEKLPSNSGQLQYSRNGYMATLFYELGDYEKADQEIRKIFKQWHINYKEPIDDLETHTYGIPWVELHVKILKKGALDPNTLKDARNYLQAYYKAYYKDKINFKKKAYYEEEKKSEEAEKYSEILEVDGYGRRYKVGLKVSNMEHNEGIPVLQAFEGYPFHKAGISNGDIILAIGQEKIQEPYDIERVLTKFNLGDYIPVNIKRGKDILYFTIIIE